MHWSRKFVYTVAFSKVINTNKSEREEKIFSPARSVFASIRKETERRKSGLQIANKGLCFFLPFFHHFFQTHFSHVLCLALGTAFFSIMSSSSSSSDAAFKAKVQRIDTRNRSLFILVLTHCIFASNVVPGKCIFSRAIKAKVRNIPQRPLPKMRFLWPFFRQKKFSAFRSFAHNEISFWIYRSLGFLLRR